MREEMLDFARRILGPCELVHDHTWTHQISSVLRVRDENDATWIVKRHGDRDRHAAEVLAYRQWVPALGTSSPFLRAVDDALAAIIVSSVPGEPAAWPAHAGGARSSTDQLAEQAVQRDAGRLLRRFHDGQPPLPWADFGAAKVEEFDSLRPAAAGLLSTRALARARAEIAALDGVTCAGLVPCHRDYTPRNWLVDRGAQYVIDFEWSRLDVWVSDLARLHIGIWTSRPDLHEAFMAGYGRQLSDADRAVLRGCAVLTAVWLLVKAHETRQPSFEDACRAALRRLLESDPRARRLES